jgi:D-3-phosphoglycerate dehydrogenase
MRINVCSSSFNQNSQLMAELRVIAGENNEVIQKSKEGALTPSETIEFLTDADIAIIGLEKLDSNALDSLPQLKLISKYGVGLDNINVEYAKSKGIQIGWTPGLNKLSVAEMTLCFLVGLSRNLFFTNHLLSQGSWQKNGGFQLSEKRIGIIGMGHIGKEVVRLLKPFYCEIWYNDIEEFRDFANEHGLIFRSKEEIYKKCDLISLHCPLTEETREMINHESLSLMKDSSFIINTARGGLISLNALKHALQQGSIRGAALDVYPEEPPTDFDLLSLPNLVSTPHIGGNSQEAVLSMGRSAISHIDKFLNK